MEHVRSVAVGVWVEAGSRHEPEGRIGMSHLIEHLVFKGTETRTAEAIARTMDSVGGQMDAFTTKEHTCFYVQVLDEHLPLAVDLLTDILLHPVFDAEELEREKSVVLQEIKMVEDTPPALKPGVNIVHKPLEQVHVIMGFPGLHHSAPERYALFVLNDVIGGSMSSRLFQEVRERQGLVYAIHSGVQAYVDTGTLYVYAASDAPNFSKVLKSILKEIRDLKKIGVTEEELRRSKDHLKGSLMLSLESTSSRMNRLAKHEMHLGSFLTIDAMLGAIDGVRHEEVQALVTELLDEDRLVLTTLGPLDRRNLPRELLRH